MTIQEHVEALKKIKENLYLTRAIYHERVTLLIELTKFAILEDRVKFEAKVIKPLNAASAENNRAFVHIKALSFIKFSGAYEWPNGDRNADLVSFNEHNGAVVGHRPYCPFTLWVDREFVQFVPGRILWREDWRLGE
jgi:hypothetical protein